MRQPPPIISSRVSPSGLPPMSPHKYQVEIAPPAPPTSGTLYEPMQSGRTVEGGARKRMEQEDADRERMEREQR
ncbi:hypothetical protein [Noviherbaspirillum massiliense]|uniref:hypothetical protein n=1 Tax=Noviherbaspirillum massiliense TaxID=1465823 RepID=UPI0011DDBEB7|nr:hypothetical protein [Noviherbaspirillum massiliense]